MAKSLKRFLLQKERELYDKLEMARKEFGPDHATTISRRRLWHPIYVALRDYYTGFIPIDGELSRIK